MRPSGNQRDACLKIDVRTLELLRVIHLGSCLHLLELGERAQTGSLGLTRAAAGNGKKCENRSGDGGKNADHGS